MTVLGDVLGFVTFLFRLSCKGPHLLLWLCMLPWKLFKSCYFLCLRNLPGYGIELLAAQAEYSKKLSEMQRKHAFQQNMAQNIHRKNLAAKDGEFAALRSKEQAAKARLDRTQHALSSLQTEAESNKRHHRQLLRDQARHQKAAEAYQAAAEALILGTQRQCAAEVQQTQQHCEAAIAALNTELDDTQQLSEAAIAALNAELYDTQQLSEAAIAALNAELYDTQQQLVWSARRHQVSLIRHQRWTAIHPALRDGFATVFAAWHAQQNVLATLQQQHSQATDTANSLQQQNSALQEQLAHVTRQLSLTEGAYARLRQRTGQQAASALQQQASREALLQQEADQRVMAVQQAADSSFANLQRQANAALCDAQRRSDDAIAAVQQQANIDVDTAHKEAGDAVVVARQDASDAVATVRQQAIAVHALHHPVHNADPQVTPQLLCTCALWQ